jgi:sugar/nucleoside kinase (ribokinase family)
VLALGTVGVAVTLGADGCLVGWRDGGAPVALPALEVDVVDTTGCVIRIAGSSCSWRCASAS